MATKEDYLAVLTVTFIAFFALVFLFQQNGSNHGLLGLVIGKTGMEVLEHPPMLSVRPPCQENDRGYDWFVAGAAWYNTTGYKPKVDKCTRGLVLQEYYCYNGRIRSSKIVCPVGYSCNDGACVPDEKVHYITQLSEYYARIEEGKKQQQMAQRGIVASINEG